MKTGAARSPRSATPPSRLPTTLGGSEHQCKEARTINEVVSLELRLGWSIVTDGLSLRAGVAHVGRTKLSSRTRAASIVGQCCTAARRESNG